MVLLLDDAGALAAQAAQIIELGATHLAAAHDLDRVDHRRIEREHAFHALAVGNLAHGEILVQPGAGAADADPFVGLDAGAFTLDHLDIDQDRVAGFELRDILAAGQLGNLLFFELLNEIHGNSPVGSAKSWEARVLLVVRVGRASTLPRAVCHAPEGGFLPGFSGLFTKPASSRAAHRSGRRARVSRSASARRQAATLAWSPEVSTSGIGRPSHSCGRVNWGYSSRPSAKLSSAAEASLPMTPGRSRTQASSRANAAISPPEST